MVWAGKPTPCTPPPGRPAPIFANVPGVGTPPAGARDDVGFLEAVLTTATSALCAVPTRVYGTWYSGGGRTAATTGPGTPAASLGNGTTTQEISANTLMWQFFQRLTLPASPRSIVGLLAHTAGSPHWTARRLVPGKPRLRRWTVVQRPTVPGVRHGLVRGRAAVP